MATPTTQERKVKSAHLKLKQELTHMISSLKDQRYDAENAGFGNYAYDVNNALASVKQALTAIQSHESALR